MLAGIALLAFAAIVYQAHSAGPKHVVLIAGDEDYRCEEALPMLARILSARHGLRTTVLYAIHPGQGAIDPDVQTNIAGLEALRTADLMVIFRRFRDLPDEQMKHIVDYVEAGKPVLGLRTATHAFQLKSSPAYARWSWRSKEWEGGFGRQMLGETWIRHHGRHGVQSTRALFAPGAAGHPILTGIRDGEIWGPSDVYGVRWPLPTACRPLLLGQVLEGMQPDAPPAQGAVNDPMMPVAWTTSFKGARVCTATMGAAADFESAGLRRLFVNAVYWALGMERQIRAGWNMTPVKEYRPSPSGFGKFVKGRKP